MCKKVDPSQKSTIGTLRTKEENSKIQTAFPGRTWIGGFELGSSGQWFWWNNGCGGNIKLSSVFWASGEPSNTRGNEACIIYNWNSASSWSDVDCSVKFAALCEIRCD